MLTTGIVLAAHSGNKYTSTTHRGLFLINELLCKTIKSPEGDFIELAEEAGIEFLETDTVKERIEKLNITQPCMTCHQQFDPYGLVFENFDSLGKFHLERHGEEVYTQAMIDGVSVTSAPTLATHLLSKQDELAKCFMRKMYLFSTGESLKYSIDPVEYYALDNNKKFNFKDMIKAIISDENFKKVATESN